MRRLGLVLFAAVLAHAELVDRIAIVIDHQVVTQAQLDEELRVAALLNQVPISRDLDARRKAALRLIEQALVRHEMDLSHFPMPSPEQIEKLYGETAQQFGGAAAFEQLEEKYQLSPAIVKTHLRFQLMLLRFLDFRFRPDVDVTEADVRRYYDRQSASWRKTHAEPPPALADSRASIVETISSERVDSELTSWLTQTERESSIVYLDQELRPE